MPKTIIARFLEKTRRAENGCLEWTACCTGAGYGQLRINRRSRSAHRLAWELVNGPIPDGLCVLHRCDNPRCVEADHLFLGTQLDNIADMTAKRRSARGDRHGSRTHPERLPRGDRHGARLHPERLARGERHGGAKLTEADVLEIRRLDDEGTATHGALAAQFGVAKGHIGKILRGQIWTHVATLRDGRRVASTPRRSSRP